MAFNFRIVVRNFAVFMNGSIACLMAFGLWRFLMRDDIYGDPSWLVWMPLAIANVVVIPVWMTWSLLNDRSRGTRIAFLILNILVFILMFVGAFADRWVTATNDQPFSLYSLAKICLILGSPCLVNILAFSLLLKDKVQPTKP